MCTVSFLPLGNNDFMLTSNRDEDPARRTIPPQKYSVGDSVLIFPKDEVAGGTWIGVNNACRLICLLNGGFENHVRKSFYKKSRGVLVKELLTVKDAIVAIDNYDLTNIEPFTIVLVDWKRKLKIYELVWTGNKKFFTELEEKPHIWSSSTLYTEETKLIRRKWFANWLKDRMSFDKEAILKFHQNENIESPEVALKMKRSCIETISTTNVLKKQNITTMLYIDYVKNLEKEVCQLFNTL